MTLKKIVLGLSVTTMIAASAFAFADETKAPANLAAPTTAQTTCPGVNGQTMMNGQAMMSPEAMQQMMNGQTCPGAANQTTPTQQTAK